MWAPVYSIRDHTFKSIQNKQGGVQMTSPPMARWDGQTLTPGPAATGLHYQDDVLRGPAAAANGSYTRSARRLECAASVRPFTGDSSSAASQRAPCDLAAPAGGGAHSRRGSKRSARASTSRRPQAARTRAPVTAAGGGPTIATTPCLFFVQKHCRNIRGRVRMTRPSVARPAVDAPVGGAGVRRPARPLPLRPTERALDGPPRGAALPTALAGPQPAALSTQPSAAKSKTNPTRQVDRYVEDLRERYGGVSSVLWWPTYPNIGVDNRNQFDMMRFLPGGVPGVRALVDGFHRHGIKVSGPQLECDCRLPVRPSASESLSSADPR
jgi:hypothetical protein